MEIQLKSKLLHSINYEPHSRSLRITMANGQKREFVDVPTYVIEDLQKAKSAGSYYVKFIKSTYGAMR